MKPRTLTLDELIAELQAMRDSVGGDALVVVGERGFELACAVKEARGLDTPAVLICGG